MKYSINDVSTVLAPTAGALSFFESNRDIPFFIRRIYYIHNVPAGVQRGGHAHKALQQLLFCPYGSVKIKLDDGRQKDEVLLDRPDKGLLLGPGLWREMLWKKDNSVLCVAASDYYDETDYIRDYDEFLAYVDSGSVINGGIGTTEKNDKKITGGGGNSTLRNPKGLLYP